MLSFISKKQIHFKIILATLNIIKQLSFGSDLQISDLKQSTLILNTCQLVPSHIPMFYTKVSQLQLITIEMDLLTIIFMRERRGGVRYNGWIGGGFT